ncbi:MAG: hypothetical protein JWQ04_2534, partial [Pedosphaera sp.]|nr:hypothetical protein [Pedosphaera sp.]
MGKPRSDSAWHGLSPEQKDTLAEWLFEQNFAYAEILERARKEFGITASKTSLCYYYQSLARERICEDLGETQATAAEADGAGLDLATLRGGAVKLIGKRLLDSVLRPGEVKDLTALANILLQNEQQEIQRAWLTLAR